jgi:nicotinamidase-related amidase
MGTQTRRIVRAQAGLLVVDMQERLLPAMHERESLLISVRRLARGSELMKLPIWVTEQYPKGLGPTLPELRDALGEAQPIEKLTFSALGAAGLLEAMTARGVSDVVLCGIEAHVCVAQTGLDLLDAGKRLFVVEDATGSRSIANWQRGIHRMRDAGATVVSTEMILFELMETAGAGEFKELQRLVK